MIGSPGLLLLKTAANYIAFKIVKSTVDGALNEERKNDQALKAVKCTFCFKVWANAPEQCPHCNYKYLKKLYKDYDYKKDDNEDFKVDNILTLRKPQ